MSILVGYRYRAEQTRKAYHEGSPVAEKKQTVNKNVVTLVWHQPDIFFVARSNFLSDFEP